MCHNSFFPPLRKVQSCIVLKAIYESPRRAGRRAGSCGRGRHTVILEENLRAEDQTVEKPTRKRHVRVFPLLREGRVRVGLNPKVQELEWCWQLCEGLRASICYQDSANHVF